MRKVRGIRDKCPPGYIVGRPADSTGDAAPEFMPMSAITGIDNGPPYTDEKAQDAVGSILVDTATIDFTYNDATPSITADFVGNASNIPYTPHDHITSTNVQAAMNEIIDEFVSKVRTGTETMVASLSITPASGVGAAFSTDTEGVVGNNLFVQNYRSDVNPPSYTSRHSRGTRASPTALLLNDRVFNFVGQARSGTAAGDVVNCFSMVGRVIEPTPSTTAMNTEVFIETTPLGSVTSTRLFQLSHSVGLQLYGAGLVVVDPSRHFRLRTYTTATLPTASPANQFAIVSDDAIIGVVPIYSDGTNWRRVVDHQVVGAATRLMPAGGTTNQVLTKTSGTDYAVTWAATTGAITIDVQEFTASGAGTWTKPASAPANAQVDVFIIGAGGGGAGGRGDAAGTIRLGAAGGAGGGTNRAQFRATELGATVTVTVGAGGTAGTGGATADGTDGGNGGDTTFGTSLFAGGGGGGRRGSSGVAGSGGSGGGSITAGAVGGTGTVAGGEPLLNTTSDGTLCQEWGGGNVNAASNQSQASYYGGGAGGSHGTSATLNDGDGGRSRWGGGGGGNGGGINAANANGTTGVGGGRFSSATKQGGGGAAGSTGGTAGTAGTAGSGYRGGDGGGGGGPNTGGTGGVGGAGGARGGGGGGGGGGTTTGGAGGVGGVGYALIITYY